MATFNVLIYLKLFLVVSFYPEILFIYILLHGKKETTKNNLFILNQLTVII